MAFYHLTDFGSGASTPLPTCSMNDGLPLGCWVTSPELRQVTGHASDLASWVDTLVYEVESQSGSGPEFHSGFSYLGHDPTRVETHGDTWLHQVGDCQSSGESQQPLTVSGDVAEDVGIRLVHTLLMCAEAVQCGEVQLAGSLVSEMTNELLTRVDTSRGIGKVAGYFIDALSHRLYRSGLVGLEFESDEVMYHHFYEACPYLKFAHFTANQAILEAFNGHDCVHVIDFGLLNGLQWPALIQALALRPGGAPSLRLTAISTASCTNRLEVIGLKLAELSKSIKVKFSFRVITDSQLEEVKPWMLQTSQGEALAVNSIFQLHRLLGSSIEPVLEWIRSLNPKIITIVEQEANLNQKEFLPRFTEALHYYSTMFDSLEACPLDTAKPLAELYLQKEICNILCCEGTARVERHEPLAKWRARLSQAGFEPLNMGHNAFKQASMLLTLCSGEGYRVHESDGCLTLGWHDRSLITASAWQARPSYPESLSVTHDGSSSSTSSS